jgi:hypothetical protein
MTPTSGVDPTRMPSVEKSSLTRMVDKGSGGGGVDDEGGGGEGGGGGGEGGGDGEGGGGEGEDEGAAGQAGSR